jgi:hypothetical protein
VEKNDYYGVKALYKIDPNEKGFEKLRGNFQLNLIFSKTKVIKIKQKIKNLLPQIKKRIIFSILRVKVKQFCTNVHSIVIFKYWN